MTVLMLYAPVLSVIGGLLIFAVLVLFGTWLVRCLRLPQELPEGIHFSPPAPALALVSDAVSAPERGRLQARLTLIHRRAQLANALVQSAHEYVAMAHGTSVEPNVAAAFARLQQAAQAADTARRATVDIADDETTILLGNAQEAFAEIERATVSLPHASRWMFLVLALITLLLLGIWLGTIIMMRTHALGAH